MLELDEIQVRSIAAPVHVRIFQNSTKVKMTRAAALHLYRLLQRYSWCLASAGFALRWMEFWPSLTPAERVLVVRTVKANCDGDFGRRLLVVNIPADFEHFEFDVSPARIASEVADEFTSILEAYYGGEGKTNALREWVRIRCLQEFAFIAAIGAVERVFGTGSWVCPEQARVACESVFLECGWEGRSAALNATTIARCLFAFYEMWDSPSC